MHCSGRSWEVRSKRGVLRVSRRRPAQSSGGGVKPPKSRSTSSAKRSVVRSENIGPMTWAPISCGPRALLYRASLKVASQDPAGQPDNDGACKARLGHQTLAESVRHSLGTVFHAELAEHPSGVGFHGVLGQEQRAADLAVAVALTHPDQHLKLPANQP